MSSSVVVSQTVAELRARLDAERSAGRTIGLVPTMGALHGGHASLVARALSMCDVVVTSIFVNPRQFGPGEDLGSYPKMLDDDIGVLADLGCQHVWIPSTGEMYPEGYGTRVELDGPTDILCGVTRATHFGGVLTVVLKLFNQVGPEVAFFGQKDYQQALLIRLMVRDLDVPVRIEVCPTVREPDGLAMSSRNRHLSPEERDQAAALNRALGALEEAWRAGETDAARLMGFARAFIGRSPLVRIDYLEIRDPATLAVRDGPVRAGDLVAVAAFVGSARLIDNRQLTDG